MSTDISWSLGEDFSQDYVELRPFDFVKSCGYSITMYPKEFNHVFKGVRGYYDPAFVVDILCPGPDGGNLASVLDQMEPIDYDNKMSNKVRIDPDETSGFGCNFVAKNKKYIVGIEYPKVTILDQDANNNKKEFADDSFTKRIVNERLAGLDSVRQDSLVTKSLLDLTSYDDRDHPGGKIQDRGPGATADVSIVIENENNPMSFDDLGKVYTNISRSRILSNVHCPNVHFHAHPDGSTTIHKHKNCVPMNPNTSLATLDPRRKTSTESKRSKRSMIENENTYNEVSDEESIDVGEEVYSSLSEELHHFHNQRSPQSVLGPLPVPPKVLSAQNSCASCSKEDPVCSIEGGIKFNPCFNNNHINSSNGNNNPDGGGNGLCDVMLDAVWHAGHSAAVHAGRANCNQCAHFSAKFQSDMADIFAQTSGGNNNNTLKSGKHRHQDFYHLMERGGMPPPPGPPPMGTPFGTLMRHPPPGMSPFPYKRGPNFNVDRNLKLLAYISVMILSVLLLIIVVIVLWVFFQHSGLYLAHHGEE